MKKFMEEYGFIVLSAMVVVLLVSFCTTVVATMKNEVQIFSYLRNNGV